MVNSPRLKYTGKKINAFDMCHVDSMSMLEIYDIAEELGNENLEIEEDDAVEEDEGYVVDGVEQTGSDSGFEDSDKDMNDEVQHKRWIMKH
ncbi:hypothetical protein V6N13_018956 [Hibiscus sabdariffa]